MYIDFHAHILPKADHGSNDIAESLSQLKNARDAGVGVIVATPHFYPQSDSVTDFLARRDAAYKELIDSAPGGIDIIKAAEVQIHASIELLDGLDELCIGDTDYILLEFPPEPWPHWIRDAVYRISARRRLRPVFAHIDRYSRAGRAAILGMNAAIQINADAFLSNRWRRREFFFLAGWDAMCVLGSDAHGDGVRAYRDFALASKKLGPSAELMKKNALKILSNGF